MLIEEIEGAEKGAERILVRARIKASERIQLAKMRSYEHLVEEAEKKAKERLEKAEAEAKSEAKHITLSSKKRFSFHAGARAKLARELAEKVVKISSVV
jgi:vacuolar-type H+-ATPase subunit H